MPTLQSTATAQALPPTREAPTGDELIAAFKNAFEGKAEVNQPPAKALFNQFQAWAVEEDAQAQVGPPQPVRDARAQVVQKNPSTGAKAVTNPVGANRRDTGPVAVARAKLRLAQ